MTTANNGSYPVNVINNATGEGQGTYSDHKLTWNIATGIICVEFVFAFILNVIVICLVMRNRKRNRMSFFVLHLAISDFLMAVFYIFPVVIDRLLDAWLAGLVMCKLMKYLSLVVCYASTYMLVVLSVDRLYAIAKPISATSRGIAYKWTLIIVAWCIACVLGSYDLVYATIVTGIPTPQNITPFCEIKYPANVKQPIISLFALMNVLIPALLIGACYTIIAVIIWRRGRQGIPLSRRKNTGDYDVYTNNRRLKTDSGIIHKAKVKTIKLSFVVVTVFLVCWGPFTLYTILVVFHVILPDGSFFILMALAPLNSMANPMVFLIFNHSILCNRKRKQRLDVNRTSVRTTFVANGRPDPERKKYMPMCRLN